ncbi:MAG: hypothetical protein KatS3mg010_1200 [Acidimicrobiia bacterium]|nr:MAG: hypothetical protein KatS3mg010_1200 [Acidimicrobiia bacterium]
MRLGARLGVAAALALGVWATVLSAPAFAHADLVGARPGTGRGAARG